MNIGILGSGKIVIEMLDFIKSINGIKIEAIIGREKSRHKLNLIAEENDINKIYTNFDDAIKDEKIDFIYVALPNNLHYEYCKKALLNGKNIICEKPFTSNKNQLNELVDIAEQKKLFLFEAITNQYLPNYIKLKEIINDIGNVKIVSCNYSQYSSRYDDFKNGEISPAFDRMCSGGALMDLNVYNIYFLVGLFGKPKSISYFPNIYKNIDTSGIAVLNYENFQGVCIGAKDCKSRNYISIQGEKGTIYVDTPSGVCEVVEVLFNDGKEMKFKLNEHKHRMQHEFEDFLKIYNDGNFDECKQALRKSVDVMELLDSAREFAKLQILK